MTQESNTPDPNSSVFDESKQQDSNSGSASPVDNGNTNSGTGDQVPEPLAQFVGEGRKYRTLDDFAKGFENANQFIEQLKEENANMRKEIEKSSSIDELMATVRASGERANQPTSDGEGTRRETPADATGLDEANVQKLISSAVEQEVTRRERQRSAEQNEAEASSKLVETAGGEQEAKAMLKSVAEELGVSVTYLREQAQISPSAFLRLVGNKTEAPRSRDTGMGTGNVNTEALNQRGSVPGAGGDVQPYSYWRNQRKNLSKAEYYSPSVQNKIFKSRQALGEAFYDTPAP